MRKSDNKKMLMRYILNSALQDMITGRDDDSLDSSYNILNEKAIKEAKRLLRLNQ